MYRSMIVKLLLVMVLTLPLIAAQIDMDYATFHGDESVAILEVYINVPRAMFEFVENEDGIYESNIFFRVPPLARHGMGPGLSVFCAIPVRWPLFIIL